MKRRFILIGAAALLALAGCGNQEASSSQSSAVPSSSQSSAVPSSSSEESIDPHALVRISVKTPGPDVFFKGETFSADGLVVLAHYGDGSERVLDNNRLVFSGINLNKTGLQTLTIEYNGCTTAYQISVFEATNVSISVGSFTKTITQRGENASAFMNPFGLTYIDHPIDTSSLLVSLSYQDGDTAVSGVLPLDDPHIHISNVSATSLGIQTAKITVKAGDKETSETFTYSVTNAIPYINRGPLNRYVELRVDSAYEGMEGAVTAGTHADTSRGYSHLFKSIGSALDFIKLNRFEHNVAKNIYVAAGDYHEKLDIVDPFVSIIGEGGDVKIHSFETLGSRHGLESDEETYVLAVREDAYSFRMENIGVINDAALSEVQPNPIPATSLLCQTDRAKFAQCSFSGVDHSVILNHGRRYFVNCSFTGRDEMLYGHFSADKFTGCHFKPLVNATENAYDLFHFDGAGNNGLSEWLELNALFDACSFEIPDNVGKYVFSTVDMAYSRVDFAACTFAGVLGNSRDTLFPSGTYSNLMYGIHFGTDTPINEAADLDSLTGQDIFATNNGRFRFNEKWDGEIETIYDQYDHIFLNFDGFSYRGDAQQTVISHDLDLPISPEETRINDALSLYSTTGIHYDKEKNMTFFAKDSSLKIRVPVGARVDFYSEVKEGNRYTVDNFAKINGSAPQDTLHIYRSPAHFYATGDIGDMVEMTFKAMGDSYLSFITIVPDVLKSEEIEDPSVDYHADPTGFYVRIYNDNYMGSFKDCTRIFGPMENRIGIEFKPDGYHRLVDEGYNKHVHASLGYTYDDGGYDAIDWAEQWWTTKLLGGKGGDINGDVVEQYYGGHSDQDLAWQLGTSAFQAVWLVYLFEPSGDKYAPMDTSDDRIAWRRIFWIEGAAEKAYRSTREGHYDFTPANLYNDASNHEFILDDNLTSAGYTLSTGDTRVCAHDHVHSGLRLEGQVEYHIKLHNDLLGGKFKIRALKGSTLNVKMGENVTSLTPSSSSSLDFDMFEFDIPADQGNDFAFFPGEGGATVFNYELHNAVPEAPENPEASQQ